ncbi:alpha/beta hydrolase-fold protein [Amorphoplanes nipponensis]|uniref:Esterase n=1 Tax=Actinoplanes nipponensis TaxID=135950 RepID=A0A919JR84_9ACTN|nr:alpha/beta hydrolase-fold protein [Actinoplanes nipponensis]GIE53987.1 esterase [Actinoplanes nipponensis]
MTIEGLPLLLTGLAAVLATAVAVAVLWDRAGRITRAALVAACVLSLAATVALQLNRLTETYTSWAALAGERDPAVPPGPGPVAAPSGPGGRVVRLAVAGRASGMTMPAYVYLPPGYQRGHQRYPVIEALHGFPGSPKSWLRRLDVRRHLDQEIAAGRMAPALVVFPYQTPDPMVDTECTDLAGGPRAETFLTVDVPAAVRASYRVRTGRGAWGLIGYSAGGFCAADLLLRHPGQYAAAASLSGYASPGIRVGDGSERTTNNVGWRLRHLPQPPAGLYLGYTADDPHSRRDSSLMAGLATAPLAVTTGVVAHGGHSDAAWELMEPAAFDWLSSWLARPAEAP